MPICRHGTPATFLESHTRYGLKAYKEPCRISKQKDLTINFLEASGFSGSAIQDGKLHGVTVAI